MREKPVSLHIAAVVLLLPSFAAARVSSPERAVAKIKPQFFYAARYHTIASTWSVKIDSWATAASTALQTDNGHGNLRDYQCPAALTRLGALDTFSLGTGRISSPEAFDSLKTTWPASVKLVREITYCKGPATDRIIEGCSTTEVIFLSADDSIPEDDTLLAHEFGHYKGVKDLTNSYYSEYIMFGTGTPASKIIGEADCRCGFMLASGVTLDKSACAREISFPGRRSRKATGGVSDEYLVSLGTGAIPFLLKRLESAPLSPDLVVRIGTYPHPEARDHRVFLALKAVALKVWNHTSAKNQDLRSMYYALRALGARGGPEGVRFLIEFNGARTREISSATDRPTEKTVDAFEGSLDGLAFSSSTAASSHLEALQHDVGKKAFPDTIRGAVEQAWRNHQVVRKYGLANLEEGYTQMWGKAP